MEELIMNSKESDEVIPNTNRRSGVGFMSRLNINNTWIKRVFLNGFDDFNLLRRWKERGNMVINAGILIYCHEDDSIILGKFKDTHDLCHFAGGLKGGKGREENIFIAALREFNEETFGCIEINEDIHSCPCIMIFDEKYKKFCYVVFIATPVTSDISLIKMKFMNMLMNGENEKKKKIEITDLIKLKLDEFFQLLEESDILESRFKKISLTDKVTLTDISNKYEKEECIQSTEENTEEKKYQLYDNLKKIIKVPGNSRFSSKYTIRDIFYHIKQRRTKE